MIIECNIFSYKLLLLLLYPIFYSITKLIIFKNASPLYKSFTYTVGYLLAGLFYLLILFRSGKNKNLSIPKNLEGRPSAITQVYEETQKTVKQAKIKKFISIILLSLINMVPMIIKILVLNHEVSGIFSGNLRLLSAILFFSIFSKIFLNSKIYRHQYTSLITIYFCLLILLIIEIFIQIHNNSFNFADFGIILLYFVALYGFYALYDVLVKNHFETHPTNPYYLMFFVGLFNFILIIPLDLVIYLYDEKGETFGLDIINQIIKLYEPTLFLWFILDIICKFLWLLGIILTLYYFTPCHQNISLTLVQLLSKCTGWITKTENDKGYLVFIYLFLYGIIFFSSLIYNELVIIHLWSMETNTFKYISLRQRLESESLLNYYENSLIKLNNTSDLSSSFDGDEEAEEKEK